jgi:hypothetical protein
LVDLAGEVLINQPVEVVFDFVVDARNEPLYNSVSFAKKVTEGDVGLGTIFRKQTSGMQLHSKVVGKSF